MSTIIGFVPPSDKFSFSYPYPLGFTENGTKILPGKAGWPDQCKLILLDDDNYASDKVLGGGKRACLVQHNTNEPKWGEQLQLLSQWGWTAIRVDKFSRIDTSSFFRNLLAIAQAENDKTIADIITSMARVYVATTNLVTFDKIAAWAVLYKFDTTNPDYKASLRDTVGLLQDNEQADLLRELINNKKLSDILDQIDQFARAETSI